MKEGWTYKQLGEVATFARGLTYSKKDEVESSKNIVLRSNNIDLLSGKLDFSELKYLDENFEIPADKRVKQGSLFICMSNGSKAHLGKVAYIDKDYNYAFGGFMGQITPTNDVDGLYLHYALSSPLYKDYIKSLSEGANINNLKFKDLSGFVIGYPSLDEQISIVSRLDAAFAKIDALKANAERQLAEARALFNRALTEEMTPKEGWEERPFEGCINKIPKQKQVKSKDYKTYGSFPIVSQEKDLISGYWDDESYLYKHDKPIIIFGDHTKEIKYIDFDFVVGADGTQLLSPKDDINTRFFYFALLNTHIRTLGYARHFKLLKEKMFFIPPINVQHSIVARLNALWANVRQLEEVQRKTLAECDALKQAMLREVFE